MKPQPSPTTYYLRKIGAGSSDPYVVVDSTGAIITNGDNSKVIQVETIGISSSVTDQTITSTIGNLITEWGKSETTYTYNTFFIINGQAYRADAICNWPVYSA